MSRYPFLHGSSAWFKLGQKLMKFPPPLFFIMTTEKEKLEKLKRKEARKKRRKEKIKKVKEELKSEFKLNAPNTITLFRLILTFFIVYMIFSGYSRLSIAIVFAIAALSDALDGFVARKFNQTSSSGGRLDQVIDRIFTVIIVLALVIWAMKENIVDKHFVIMLFLISSREIIGLAGIVIRFVRNKDLYEVRYIGKLVCWFQGVALFFIIAGFSFAIYFAILACGIGIISGFDYLKRSFI